MGYYLQIGEAQIEWEDGGGEYEPHLSVGVAPLQHDAAPDFSEFGCPTGATNERSPSYSSWSGFCRETGLYTLFFGRNGCRPMIIEEEGFHRETPLLANHPGFAALFEADARFIRQALERRRATTGGKPPGFWRFAPGSLEPVENGTDPQLARLMWLDYWVDWAVKNCDRPILANS